MALLALEHEMEIEPVCFSDAISSRYMAAGFQGTGIFW
jgi:hypothetical protein